MTARLQTAALVALLRLGHHSGHDVMQLLEEAGSATAALDRVLGSDGAQASLLPTDAEPLLERASSALDAWAERGIRLLTVIDAEYPANLREVRDRPAFVFVAGALAREDVRSIAIIGARRASADGLALATRCASALNESGYTVVSGLAAGIDTAAHQAALERSGRTIAVIGTGLDHCYPPENAALQGRIARHGAVVSQFWPDAPPTRGSFPMRNAVMSGLSRGSLLVEASERSGARVQARLALAHGRPVFLHERLLEQAWARELAGRPGVSVVRSADEVVAAVEADLSDERARD
jgi:DNA processing protein